MTLSVFIAAALCGSGIYFATQVRGAPSFHQVRRGSLKRATIGVGRVESAVDAPELGFLMAGRLKRMHVTEGQRIVQGQLLATLDDHAIRLEEEAAQANLERARAVLVRQSQAARPELIQQVREQLERARLQVSAAQTRLRNLEAPERPRPAPDWVVEEARKTVERAKQEFNWVRHEQKHSMRGLSSHQQAAASAKIEMARIQVEEAEGILALEGEKWRVSNADRVRLEMDVKRRRKQLELVQEEVAVEREGPAVDALAASQARIAAAKVKLEVAEAQWQRRLNPPQPEPAPAWQISLAKNDLANAQSAQREAQAALDRLLKGPTKEDLEAARVEVEQAEKNLELVREKRSQTRLVAPIDGVVAERRMAAGSIIPSHVPVVVLRDLSHLQVRAEMDVRFLPDLKVGQLVRLSNESVFKECLNGKVSRINSWVGGRRLFNSDPSSIRGGEVMEVVISIQAPSTPLQRASHRLLKQGLRLDVKIEFASLPDVLCVPRSFVETRGGKYWAYRAGSVVGGVAEDIEAVEVQLGFRDDVQVEILGGVQEGDVLVRPNN